MNTKRANQNYTHFSLDTVTKRKVDSYTNVKKNVNVIQYVTNRKNNTVFLETFSEDR